MLIISQNQKALVVMEQVGQIYVEEDSAGFESPIICCDFPDGRTAILGKYKDVRQCVQIIQAIAAYEESNIFYMPPEV